MSENHQQEEFGNELGGARALLQLGNKIQPNEVDVEAAVMKLVGGIESASNGVHGGHTGTGGTNISNVGNNMIKSNGNNNNNNNKKRRLVFSTDELSNLNEFQQWTGFLEEELHASTQNHVDEGNNHNDDNTVNTVNDDHDGHNHDENGHHEHVHDEHGQDENVHEDEVDEVSPFLNTEISHTPPSKRHRRVNNIGTNHGAENVHDTHNNTNNNNKNMSTLNVDPELAQLDTITTDHEQLVQSAMMNANELENEFGPFSEHGVSNYFKNNNINSTTTSNTSPNQQQLQEHTTQAVVAAAQQAAQHMANQGGAGFNSRNNGKIPKLTKLQETQQLHQLRQQQHQQQQQQQQQQQKKKRGRKPTKNETVLSSNENVQIVSDVVTKAQSWLTAEQGPSDSPSSEKLHGNHDGKHEVGNIDEKSSVSLKTDRKDEANKKSRQSISQSSSVQQGKTFTKEECDSIDTFILAYCEINNMSREQICQRIWSNMRQKDDFWESLQKVLPSRSRASLYKHVRRTYHIFQVRGKWTPYEEAELGKLAAENPGNWKLIGSIMGRMPEDCRDRFRNYVKCGKNRSSNKWSAEEENLLRDIINEMLHNLDNENEPAIINWTLVSEKMNGRRSRIQCRYKWNKLNKRTQEEQDDGDETENESKNDYGNNKKDNNSIAHSIQDVQVRNQNLGDSVESIEVKLWLLQQLKSIYNNEQDIAWDIIFSLFPFSSTSWKIKNGDDLKKYFESLKLKYLNDASDWKDKSFDDNLNFLIERVSIQ
ncbi:hypothetical protein PACTADRAFT_48334 [Pachysolen tannophilus NRRL Y-2460]|uniref:DNA-binding protein REB1 n=1 Tax=Pachysolen tannophilus NRRL Y-2460 TaxID=669874 RepID=A0A1E4U3N5_PACTA|nr:hypothetical protein PACTADRAFT_48334 [Pachysolen tannophilus NRRL Y-2460]